ncbi:hypothetical protein CLOM_g7216 [Closterium sp. NIES-68]|nr:hypothetical protein CLOM_g7216 [Closterium sp. NIES-68]GJP79028.1 hypothetical protein CLOP_g9279 [Closterium sp. NIES-67]
MGWDGILREWISSKTPQHQQFLSGHELIFPRYEPVTRTISVLGWHRCAMWLTVAPTYTRDRFFSKFPPLSLPRYIVNSCPALILYMVNIIKWYFLQY